MHRLLFPWGEGDVAWFVEAIALRRWYQIIGTLRKAETSHWRVNGVQYNASRPFFVRKSGL